MTSHHSSQTDALRKALRVAIPVEDHDKVAARRAQLVELIGSEIEAAPERALRKRAATQALRWSAAAAIVVAAGGAAWLLAAPSSGAGARANAIANSANDSTETSGSPGSANSSGAAISTKTSAVRQATAGLEVSGNSERREELTFPGSTSMTLSGAGALRVLTASASRHEVSLHDGSLLVDVPPRPGVEKLVQVNTPHAKVRVKGTRFNVEVHGATNESTGSTTVHVLRGVVEVAWHDERLLLERGERWSSEQAEKESVEHPATPDRGLSGAASANQATASSQPDIGKGSAAAASTLAAQNALLVAAVRAERQGNLDTALERVEELLARYPDSPLRATALSERRRLQDLKQKD